MDAEGPCEQVKSWLTVIKIAGQPWQIYPQNREIDEAAPDRPVAVAAGIGAPALPG
ncbi:hypothetical protein [Mycobacterium colombiense]|uniref:hypothetical protein n=1 Tax=Mycobacterium colombiense TaxID=339268 RepID=UPI0015C1B86E|nr:hypothetical protein [Mycobacterium colombiense]